MNSQEIIEKIKDILSNELEGKKVYDKDVAEALGISKESLSHFKKRNSVPLEQIVYFCAKRKISINWILFSQEPKSLEEDTNRYVRVRYFSKINAGAGGGAINEEEEYEFLHLDKKLLDTLYTTQSVKAVDIAALNVIGDSMEPTLQNQEVVIFDTKQSEIKKGGIFIVATNAGLFVKRITQRVDGSIELISDNKNYNSEILSEDE
ncbi:MAG TPA: LexA family transcriptional regulator, partial [Nitratifractor sp.]|nr:LexA family transcriptional regulator [Nitratifractor sp.]